MTDCENAEMRDLLPDLAAGMLPAVEAARVRAHVDACLDCRAELAVIRAVRSVRRRAASVDVAGIVARLPRPSGTATAPSDPSVISLDAHRAAVRPAFAGRRARSVLRVAATVGVIIAGGWSVVMVQRGGIGLPASQSDSARLAAAAARGGLAIASDTQVASAMSSTLAASDANGSEAGVAVSFGDVGNYTDEELQRVLDRLDGWDGATSTESVTTAPILPIPGGGTLND